MRTQSCGEKGCKSPAEWVRDSKADATLRSHLCNEHWKQLRQSNWTAALHYSQLPIELTSKQANRSTLSGKRLVICEDEGITALQLSRGLTSHGLIVVGLTLDGLKSVELVEHEVPDIVLMDVCVQGLDGLSAAEGILAWGNRVCIVMISALSDEELIQRAHAMGVMGWIVKPVSTSELIARLEMAWAAFEEQNAQN